MTIDGTAFRVDGELAILAAAPVETRTGYLQLRIPAALLRFAGARYAPVQIRDVDALVATSTLDVTRRWSFAGGRARAGLTLRDLRAVRDLPVPNARTMGIRGGPRRGARHGDDVTAEGLRGRPGSEGRRSAGDTGTFAVARVSSHRRVGARARSSERADRRTRCCTPSQHLQRSGTVLGSANRRRLRRDRTRAGSTGGGTIQCPGRRPRARCWQHHDRCNLARGQRGAVVSGCGGDRSPYDLSAGARERYPTIRSHTAELSGRFPMSSASPAVTELHGCYRARRSIGEPSRRIRRRPRSSRHGTDSN